MGHPTRIYYSESERQRIFDRWLAGASQNAISIRKRPAGVEDRAVPGHWEGDLLFGSNNSQIATLVERHTRYVMLVRVPSKDTKTVINALIRHAHKLPRELYKSLNWDGGKEVADRKRFSLATDIDVYFCDRSIPDNEARTRTQTDYSGSTSRRAWTCRTCIRIDLTLWPSSSMTVRERLWVIIPQQGNFMNVLRRPIESLTQSGRSLFKCMRRYE